MTIYSQGTEHLEQKVVESTGVIPWPYPIEVNTIIFKDPAATNFYFAYKQYKCLDVFSSEVYAKNLVLNKRFRVVSIIYDESQILNIDLRENTGNIAIDCYIFGYSILDNGTGSTAPGVYRMQNGQAFEFYLGPIKTNLANICNQLNTNQTSLSDQIIMKKDNVGTIPFRRINVFNSNIYVKNFENNSLLKVIDIYRPAMMNTNLVNPPLSFSASWFVTAMPIDTGTSVSNGKIFYIKNPSIIEK